MAVLNALAKRDDLDGVDVDPAGYLTSASDQLELFAEDWTARQRDLGLRVVRSQGRFVPSRDVAALKIAIHEPLADDVVRVVSLHETWLRPRNLRVVVDAVKACDNPLAFVFASVMDPLAAPGAVDALRELREAAAAGGRRVELLRTDASGIGFAAEGGDLGAIGLSTSGRHHGLPMGRSQLEKYRERQRWPLVFVPSLACWQRGNWLGALTEFAGAGITDCGCDPCGGRSLLRFDRSWPQQVPPEVRRDAQAHDLAEWSRLAGRVLAHDEPAQTWAKVCGAAIGTAAEIAASYRVALKLPTSLNAWADKTA
jgi:hypothetical protein